MGLLKAAFGAAGGVLADQWKEYFYCESIEPDILVVKGKKRTSEKRSSNTRAEDNIISNGSVVAVNDGQCMIIVEQGKVAEICAARGVTIYRTFVGEYMTALEMAGASISVLRLDPELKALLDAPADAIAFKQC